jgi:arginyl-tRNA--protein-N-Asp/Glu arginylyltransferase
MLIDANFQLINEEFFADRVTPEQHDMLLDEAWRHFGRHFFRYNLAIYDNDIRLVVPLRIRLSAFNLSKSQRRTLRRNADAEVKIGPVNLADEALVLFERHKRRFTTGEPSTIYDFLAADGEPVEVLQLEVRRCGRLVAASFFDHGADSISSIYGMFDPEQTAFSLGIFTMLKEIEYASASGRSLYYHGYAYEGTSFYDYKKRFSALEMYDWRGRWLPFDDR